MPNLIRITIKGTSGYGPVAEAYDDRLVITSSSISYEYKPRPMSQSEMNIYENGSYKTTSPVFKELFSKVVEMTPYFLHNDEVLFATDIGPTIITATFDDKHRETVHYFCPSEFFEEYFRVIKADAPRLRIYA